ncbi:hypothetical protein GCM10022281_25570 [Sphingomonas rosea]|uniref:histidine kinase n=1 Tax=Sphingomonas rosea TaxID=335605 RepID=A0ABP7UHA6_9SPHN
MLDEATPATPQTMIDLFRVHDWAATPLGARETWPAVLTISVQTMLASLHPMCLIWGPERILLYNDGYAPVLFDRHPAALGRPTAEVWPELWPDIAPLIDGTFAGQSVAFKDQPMTMTRRGFAEQTWWDFAYSPVRDETGQIVGLLNVTSDSTPRVMAAQERDQATRKLAANEAKWHGLFETLQEGFVLGEVIRDPAGTVTDFRYEEVNSAWYDLVEMERGSMVGRTMRELFPDAASGWIEEIAQVVDTGEAIRFTRHSDRLKRWFEGICQPAGGDCFTMLFVDVTARIRADARREALAELGRTLFAARDSDEAEQASTALIARALGVARVGYATLGEDGTTYTIASDWAAEGLPSLVGPHVLDDYGRQAEELRQGQMVVIADVENDPRTAGARGRFAEISVRSLVNQPIVEDGRTVAVLFIGDREPREWQTEELSFVADAASRIRAGLARRRAEQDAREAAAFMGSVLAASTDCIKVLELDGSLSFMSDGGMQVMEVSDFNAVRGCAWPDFLDGDGPDHARAALEAAKRGETTHFEAPADTFAGNPRHWSVSVSPIEDAQGNVARILSVSRDHTELQQARVRQQLLNAELAHRIKNTMSLVQAIAQQTLGKSEDQAAVAAFGRRLSALAAAHDVLTGQSWSEAKFGDVARAALASFGEDRFILSGPDVTIGPRATLAASLLFHELATNAVKYGALSAVGGKVEVRWSVSGAEGGETFDLVWAERGGPPAVEPQRKGFGSRVIGLGLAGSGGVERQFEATGLTVRASAPLRDMQTE